MGTKRDGLWKVGELASRTGVSVRALHHYEQIGVLVPSHRTSAGHRLYGAKDVSRLQQIVSLRALGFSLHQIAACQKRPGFSPLHIVEMHLARTREQLALQHKLIGRLEGIATALRQAKEPSLEDLVDSLEVMNMFETYFTKEQLEEIQARGRTLGDEGLRKAEADWGAVIEGVRDAMDAGADPTSEPVKMLARKWTALVCAFSGGNGGVEQSLRTMYQQEPSAGARFGGPRHDPAMQTYVGQALAAVRAEGGPKG